MPMLGRSTCPTVRACMGRDYGDAWRKERYNGRPSGYKKNEYARKKKVAAAVVERMKFHIASGLDGKEAEELAVADVEASYRAAGNIHFSKWVDNMSGDSNIRLSAPD
jgi:hypothetical protein